MKAGNLDGQGLAELRNYNIQRLATAPTSNLYAGRFYYNTTDNTVYVYNGTSWIDALSQGDYTFKNGIELVAGTRDVQLKLGTSSNATLTADSSGLAVSVEDASTSGKGVIEIASDVEASAGTSEVLAVNPKQLATKVDKLVSGPTAGTYSRVAVNSEGQVTSGGDISVENTSADYMSYNTSTGELSLNVDTTVTDASTNLITSGAVSNAIALALTGALKYQGTWTATGQTDYSSITLPVSKGFMYAVSGTATIDGVEWNSGDYLVIKNDVASGGTITSSDVEKIDNTEASDIVRLSSVQTLTNKTIDADDNTITNLETDNFKSGVIRTSTDGIRDVSNASDTALATEKAIASAFASKTYSEQNTALTVSGGVCTWTVTHNLGTTDVIVEVYEVGTGDKVMYDSSVTSTSVVTIKILSASNISADTYKVVVKG